MNNLYEYQIPDLNRIFIRAKQKNGNFGDVSLKEVTDSEFELWADRRFKHLLPEEIREKFGQVWNYHEKVHLLNTMNEVLGRECVVMRRY